MYIYNIYVSLSKIACSLKKKKGKRTNSIFEKHCDFS